MARKKIRAVRIGPLTTEGLPAAERIQLARVDLALGRLMPDDLLELAESIAAESAEEVEWLRDDVKAIDEMGIAIQRRVEELEAAIEKVLDAYWMTENTDIPEKLLAPLKALAGVAG